MQSFTRRPLPTHKSQIPIDGGIRGMKRKKSRYGGDVRAGALSWV